MNIISLSLLVAILAHNATIASSIATFANGGTIEENATLHIEENETLILNDGTVLYNRGSITGTGTISAAAGGTATIEGGVYGFTADHPNIPKFVDLQSAQYHLMSSGMSMDSTIMIDSSVTVAQASSDLWPLGEKNSTGHVILLLAPANGSSNTITLTNTESTAITCNTAFANDKTISETLSAHHACTLRIVGKVDLASNMKHYNTGSLRIGDSAGDAPATTVTIASENAMPSAPIVVDKGELQLAVGSGINTISHPISVEPGGTLRMSGTSVTIAANITIGSAG
ncbi:MAG: hypothetical protein LBF56_03285 [Holosporales bacterium]|jgi:hypothetical protein|nr:hypothetical protein [Holosporales bacterium]